MDTTMGAFDYKKLLEPSMTISYGSGNRRSEYFTAISVDWEMLAACGIKPIKHEGEALVDCGGLAPAN